jgi:hypothetical protein
VLVGVTLFSISVRDCDVAANVVGPGGSFSFAWIKHDMGWPLCFQLSNDAAGCAHALWKCDLVHARPSSAHGAFQMPKRQRTARWWPHLPGQRPWNARPRYGRNNKVAMRAAAQRHREQRLRQKPEKISNAA